MGMSMTEAFNLLAQRAISEYKNPRLTKEDNTFMLNEIKVLVSSLVKKYNAEYAILFGSYARGEATEESEIDIIIAGGKSFSALDVLAFGEELKELAGKK